MMKRKRVNMALDEQQKVNYEVDDIEKDLLEAYTGNDILDFRCSTAFNDFLSENIPANSHHQSSEMILYDPCSKQLR
jgi:hypothetical protein